MSNRFERQWRRKKRQNEALNKKTNKKKPPYWRIVQLLKKLRLKYREHNKGENSFHITIDDFGIVLRFSQRNPMTSYTGWDIVDVDLDKYEKNPIEFGQNLMWLLIAKGYMAYLRGGETGQTQIFRHFLINEGWATRILDKRLELYNNEPRHKFMIAQTRRLKELPVHYVVMHYPSTFDYLW